MANTYTLISSYTVGAGGASSISFSTIPNTYTDLLLDISVRSSLTGSTGRRVGIRFNGAGADTNLSSRLVYGDGSIAGSFSTTTGFVGWTGDGSTTASVFNNAQIYIPNYAGSTNKSFSTDSVMENNATASYGGLFAGLFTDTTAISSLSLFVPDGGNFVQYSTAYLYGIKNS